jgi:hypothetical protein
MQLFLMGIVFTAVGRVRRHDTEGPTLHLKLPQAPLLLRNLAQLRHGNRFGLLGTTSSHNGDSLNGSGAGQGGRYAGITAAEQRCLTIATELVNRPGLVLLEDPFADLQWQDAERVRDSGLLCLCCSALYVLGRCTGPHPLSSTMQ